jgi:hypothetical protein
MTAPGQQERDLMERTRKNLDYILKDKVAQELDKVFEVTQLVNSFLGILTHPWEKLFDADALAELELDSEEYSKLGFPSIKASWSQDTEHPRNLAHLLRLMRNGIAHGNIDLLNREDLKRQFGKEPRKTLVKRDEIAGAEIWNNKEVKDTKDWPQPAGKTFYKEEYRSWGTVLTIDEMRECLNALHHLAENRAYLRGSSLRRDGGRRTQMQAKTAIRKRIQEDRSQYMGSSTSQQMKPRTRLGEQQRP